MKPQSSLRERNDVDEPSTLDRLAQTYARMDKDFVPADVVRSVLSQELGSKRDIPLSVGNGRSVSFDRIPERFYFLLWTLRHSDSVPLAGLVSTEELFTALAELGRNILLLKSMIKNGLKRAVVLEHLGLAYFDLAGIAHFSPKGLYLFEVRCSESQLLRGSVEYFQQAIKAETEQAKNFETNHSEILAAAESAGQLKGNRTDLYLNPWLFLYTASALHLLNDTEAAVHYLDKVQSIVSVLPGHQNDKVRSQREVIDAVCHALMLKDSVRFDLENTKLHRIKRKRRRLSDRNSKNGERSLSPVVINSMVQEPDVQKALVEGHILTADQLRYLQSVSAIYQKVPKSAKRDRLIFRLNMTPLRIKGLQTSLRNLVDQNPSVRACLPGQAEVSVN